MMCGFTALGAFLLSVAYKGGSSPVAGIVLLSIGGACNLWACFWRMQPLGGGDGDDRFCTDHDCAPVGCHYVPVFLMIGGAALGLSDGDAGLELCGMLCLFPGLVLIILWYVRRGERQARERRQLEEREERRQLEEREEREERARAAVPGAARVHLRTLAGESLPLDVDLPDETLRFARLRIELLTGATSASQRLFLDERLLPLVPGDEGEQPLVEKQPLRCRRGAREQLDAQPREPQRLVGQVDVERQRLARERAQVHARRAGDRGACALLAFLALLQLPALLALLQLPALPRLPFASADVPEDDENEAGEEAEHAAKLETGVAVRKAQRRTTDHQKYRHVMATNWSAIMVSAKAIIPISTAQRLHPPEASPEVARSTDRQEHDAGNR